MIAACRLNSSENPSPRPVTHSVSNTSRGSGASIFASRYRALTAAVSSPSAAANTSSTSRSGCMSNGEWIRPTRSTPRRNRSRRSSSPGPVAPNDSGSRASGCPVNSSVTTASSTNRQSGPTCDKDSVTVPGHTGIRPSVGLWPVTPQNEAGMRIDPPASEPSAIGTDPAATVAADPELDPPQLRIVFQGLRVTPVSGEIASPFPAHFRHRRLADNDRSRHRERFGSWARFRSERNRGWCASRAPAQIRSCRSCP